MSSVRFERLALLVALGVTLGWLTIEEKTRLGAAVFALPWAALIGVRVDLRSGRPVVDALVRALIAGGLLGPLAALLMLLKIGLHAHPVPDYDVADVLAMLAWTPLAAALGALFGLGLGLIRKALIHGNPHP